MRNCGLWMKADLALTARLGMVGLKLESGLQLNPDPSLEICLVRLKLRTARFKQCF